VPTEEQIKQVEERYTALAQPAEFDGIRTQIAKELGIPKKAVKKIIKDFRSQEHIPSWWELQTYKGSNEELEKIKAVYQPYLPVPPVGVHKNIAETLDLKPGIVYQAIKAIRQEMELPQYNNPDLHEEELKQIAAKRQAEQAAKVAERKQEDSEKEAATPSDQSQDTPSVEAKGEEKSNDRSEEPKVEEKQEPKEDVTTLE
jgi:predicted regulator of amino acid metabolism with ACT domain